MKIYKAYSIGRDPDNDIFFDEHSSQRSLYISNHHAVLKVTIWGKYYINDFSTNGTTVNGHRIASNMDVEVRRGDSIVFGGVDGAGELDWSMIVRPRTPIYIAVAVALALTVLLLMVNKCQERRSPSVKPVVDEAAATVGGSTTKEKKDTTKRSDTKKGDTYKYNDKKQEERANDEDGQDVADDETKGNGDSFLDKFLHPSKPDTKPDTKSSRPQANPATKNGAKTPNTIPSDGTKSRTKGKTGKNSKLKKDSIAQSYKNQ